MNPKVRKIVDRVLWGLLFLLIVYLLAVIGVQTKPIETLQRTSSSKSFMKQLVAGHYEKAFDVAYDRKAVRPSPGNEYETSRAAWAAKIKRWKEDGTYIVSYRDLKSSIDDMAVLTNAFVTISHNGQETEHWAGFYLYKKSDGSFGIEGLHFLNGELLNDEWEQMFRNLGGQRSETDQERNGFDQ
ncbi:hypothetical protein [Paenibacillus oceani]|uniref:Uncharacterized protein n=1 Tax=Paenibacillus oceani TaxID=2772510 RepID=A0A927H2C8_9BACL|nr:hypothetical protein [Paenibacillus oceani]MBD2865218.1 hypothetical protein [Paenibacillus oceani]